MKFDDAHDDQAIDDCLYEAVLAEALGLDAVWLAEHHFTVEPTTTLDTPPQLPFRLTQCRLGLGDVATGLAVL
jgi:hypothetical protein